MTSVVAERSLGLSVRQTLQMTKRSTLEILRQPAMSAPSMIFPLFFAALGASSFGKTTSLPGFPKVDSFLQFSMAATVIQGVLFGSISGAAALATDIENKFFDRLLLAPSTRSGIVLARLAGSALFGAFQAAFFLLVLWPFGGTIRGGIPAFLVMVASGGLVSLAIGALMASVAIKTGSAEAVQGAFPLIFILLFFSSAFFPRETMSGTYRKIADVNPISHLVEGLREMVLHQVTMGSIAKAILIPIAVCIAATLLALGTLRARLAAL